MFVHFDDRVVNADEITSVLIGNLIPKGSITIVFRDRTYQEIDGPDAFNLVMELCPQALEGKQAKYKKHAWAIHNLIGHPLMQICSWLHLTRLGIKIHDATVPNPRISNG